MGTKDKCCEKYKKTGKKCSDCPLRDEKKKKKKKKDKKGKKKKKDKKKTNTTGEYGVFGHTTTSLQLFAILYKIYYLALVK